MFDAQNPSSPRPLNEDVARPRFWSNAGSMQRKHSNGDLQYRWSRSGLPLTALCVWLLSASLTRGELITAEAFRQNVNGFHKKLSLVSQGLGLINRVVLYFTESFDKREMHPLVKRKCDLFEKSDLHH